MTRLINLDNNATTSVDPKVAKAMFDALVELSGNPSSIHRMGREAKQALTAARDTIAAYCGVTDREIIFTSGGTEGMNLLIRGFLDERPGHAITSNVEHSCVFNTLKEYDNVTFLEPGTAGACTPEAVAAAIRPDTRLIALMAVNNETGVKTDIQGIAAIAEKAGIPFVVDGVALLGKEKFSIPRGVSGMAFSGHKFHAPKGVGFVFLRRGCKIKPCLTGGGHEHKKRSGTENLAGIVAMAAAIDLVRHELSDAELKMRELRDYFESGLAEFAPIHINGEGERVCNTSNIAFEGIDGETLLMHLDRAGIAASHGSACSSGALEPSRVLLNMGLSQERARSSVRFSLSRDTTREEIEATLSSLKQIFLLSRSK